MSMSAGQIELTGIAVRRGGTVVVPQLDLTIAAPGWFGLVGANGSGKTTLLRAIAGRLPIERGTIRIAGHDLSHDRSGRAEAIGFAVEPAMLPRELTPREVIVLADPRPGQWDRAALDPLADALRLGSLLDTRITTLSAGNLQRVAIYAAFLGLPRFVILDEPFNWLDPVVTLDLKDALRDLVVAQGIGLVTALHDLATLTTRCDSAGLLAQGRLVRRFDQTALRDGMQDPIGFERAIAAELR